jgi:hypothetical protein
VESMAMIESVTLAENNFDFDVADIGAPQK